MNGNNFGFELDHDRLVKVGERWMRDVKVVLPQEWVDKIAHGYMCVRCYQPLEHAFPETCPLCGFEIADRQADEFRAEFEGQVDQYLPDPQERIEETRKRLQAKGVWTPR